MQGYVKNYQISALLVMNFDQVFLNLTPTSIYIVTKRKTNHV